MFCTFTEIYWSLDEFIWNNIEEWYKVIFLKSPLIIISTICFYFNPWEMANAIAHKEEHTVLEIQNTGEVHILDFELFMFVEVF